MYQIEVYSLEFQRWRLIGCGYVVRSSQALGFSCYTRLSGGCVAIVLPYSCHRCVYNSHFKGELKIHMKRKVSKQHSCQCILAF